MDEYMGIIKIFAGNFAPRGWAFCNGQLISIAQNSALFSLLGTVYGGDGIQTFALPDLRGRVPVHAGQGTGPGLSPYVIGEVTGTEQNTLTINNMPAHNHPVSASMSVSSANATQSAATANASIATPGAQEGRAFNPTFGFNGTAADTQVNGLTVTVGPSGGNQPFNNIQPSLGINYIICMQGIYPSRE